MKKLICTSILAVLIASATVVRAQDYPQEYLGLPGDNLNLYAVMKLFQESETLEAFERNLNDENSRINNLDLNGDNMTDYITVSDFVDGNVHNIVLRAVLGRNEYQDVAVFTVEKFRNGSVQIQLVGDEDLYGKNYIVEPIYAETANPGYRGRTVYRDNVTVVTTTYYEVAGWPVIRFIFNPFYVSWHSSWYWGYYPVYWHPWRPWYWHYYYGYHYNWFPHYYAHYRHWDHPRYYRYNDYYYSHVRAHSVNVAHRVSAGNYRQTYSRPESRRDGEALYARTYGSRSSDQRTYSSASGSERRTSPSVNTRSAGSTNASGNREAVRRSSAPVQNKREVRQSGTTTRRSQPSVTQRSTEQRTQSSVSQRSSVQRSQPSVSQRSSAQRSQPSVSQRSSAQRSQSSVSHRSSAPSARSKGQVRSSQGRSSSSSSQKSSKASKSSDDSRSSRR
jgi:hypothetical protein